MTKQATSIRLSAEAEQDIKTIRARFPHMNDTTAIEHALHETALAILAAHTAPAAARCAKCGETMEKHPTRRCHKFEKPLVTPANWFDGDND